MLRSLFISLILTVFCGAFVLHASAQTSANATWRVQKYDLDVTLPASAADRNIVIRATLTVKNVSASPVSSLTLRISPNAEITAAKINDASVDVTKAEEKVGVLSLQRLGTRFASVAPDGAVTAIIDYKLNVKENSSLNSVSPVGAQLLPRSFWYPTPNSWFFAKGVDTAPVRIKVNARGLGVAASGSEGPAGFEQKVSGQPFFVVGSWDTQNLNGVTVLMPKGGGAEGQKRAGELASLFTEARTFIAASLGSAPDTPLRIVASHRGGGFASAGTVIVDDAVFRRPAIDSLTAMNLAEAAAKLWLGGSIQLTGEGNGAIGEGLSRYLATQFIESKFGKDVADIERLRQRTAYAAVSKRDAPMATVTPLDDLYYPVVGNKGAMVWRLLAKRLGPNEFNTALKAAAADGAMTLPELRAAFSSQKPILDYFFDQTTDMNLLAGIPQAVGADTRVALRNNGATDVTVDVVGVTASGERVTLPATIQATSFGEVIFRGKQVVRAEVDADKLFPQTDYSDDVAPRETTDSDPLLAAKRAFDKQDYATAEKAARTLLSGYPRFDDLRIHLGRSLLALGRTADAEREFKAVLGEKLPTARSVAWANVGLAEAAFKGGQVSNARAFADTAVLMDADYGASLAARNLRQKIGGGTVDASVKAFFTDFDHAVAAKRKADVDAMILPGEISRFASTASGSAESWQTQVTFTDSLGPDTMLVQSTMNIRLLNKEPESGIAVYRLARLGGAWKLAAVDMFEVR